MSSKNEINELKLRYRCSNCKNLESHHANNKKRKCEKCGTTLSEITEKDYRHYKNKLKKELEEEDKKETVSTKDKEKEKKKKKKSEENDDNNSQEDKKKKNKLKRNSSSINIDNKEKKKRKNEVNDEDKKSEYESTKEKDKKTKKKNRHKSIEKLGPVISNIVSNIFNGGGNLEKELKKLEKLDYSEFSNLDGATIVVNHDGNNQTQVVVNNKEIATDVFDPIFNSFGSIFNDDFVNNVMQNFASFSTNDNDYFEEIQNMVNNNQQYALENGSEPVKDKTLSKLKKFKLTSKYCKKDKNGKIELPNCCICLSEIMKGKETILLPCGHMFHSKCCLSWLKTNNTCPMCRFEIK